MSNLEWQFVMINIIMLICEVAILVFATFVLVKHLLKEREDKRKKHEK